MNQEQIGKFISELRREKGITQAELGEKIGVTNKTISRWENGNYMPDISVMQTLCAELDISVNELISGKRIDDDEFKQNADNNLIETFGRLKQFKRHKAITDFLSGGGTGMLVSCLWSPDSARKAAVILAAIVMIAVGWYRTSRYENYIIKLMENKETDRVGM